MIQQLFCLLLSFLLTIAYHSQVGTLGGYFGLPAGLLAWCVPSFMIYLCSWKLSERKSDIWTGVSAFVFYLFISVYLCGGFVDIVLDIARALGLGVVGVFIGTKLNK